MRTRRYTASSRSAWPRPAPSARCGPVSHGAPARATSPPMPVYDFQAGGTNHHYGRIAHWLAGNLWRRLPDSTINVKVGTHFKDLSAVGDGLAHMGVYTPAAAARLCFAGLGRFERPR